MYDLFEDLPDPNRLDTRIAEGAMLLSGFLFKEPIVATAVYSETILLDAIQRIIQQAPFAQMTTPGGRRIAVSMTSCGSFGWVSDHSGYRYQNTRPGTNQGWPAMPESLLRLAQDAATQAGYGDFQPDSCLVNCYQPGIGMSLHQDNNEHDASAPIVSVSLGLPAVFLFGGTEREDKTEAYRLEHGDVVVWGGASRFCFHGVKPLNEGYHKKMGKRRINLTFRKVR
jgi:alkylated DNA repair protein (DNA oxidative demethylase)